MLAAGSSSSQLFWRLVVAGACNPPAAHTSCPVADPVKLVDVSVVDSVALPDPEAVVRPVDDVQLTGKLAAPRESVPILVADEGG